MMKPTNLKSTAGCKISSSDCVIYQGEDIDCLDICSPITLSELLHELGCNICTLNDQLDVDTYDLTCLNISACDIPHTFRELQQYLIELICQLTNNILTPGNESSSQLDIVMTVASCFQSEGFSQSIEAYVSAIGQKVCEQEITIQNQQLAILQMQEDIAMLKAQP